MSKPGYLFVLPWELQRIGGVNQVVANLMSQMEAHGEFHPYLMVQSWDKKPQNQASISGKEAFRLRLREPWNQQHPIKTFAGFLIELPITLLRLRRYIREQNIAVINLHYPTLSGINFVVLRWLGLFSGVFILSVHGSDLMNAQLTRGLTQRFWKLLLKKSDWVVTCSENLSQQVLAFCPNASSYPILNGIDSSSFLDEMEVGYIHSPQLETTRYIVNVAAFEFKKGQDILLRAFSEIANRFPDVLLVLIGQVGPAYTDLVELIEELDLGSRVLVIKDMPHGKVATTISNAALFVLPSRIEPFGIVLLEAGLLSVPVVATRTGGIQEIITHEKNGILVDAENVTALSKEIARLLEDIPLGKILSECLRQDVLTKFTWKRALEKYVELAR